MALVGITMGCPVGIGPEIVLKYCNCLKNDFKRPIVVIGDPGILQSQAAHFGFDLQFSIWNPGNNIPKKKIAVFQASSLNPQNLNWGQPDKTTGTAMANYIEKGVELAQHGAINGIVTCPIAKWALQMAGYNYPGHTEMLADLTKAKHFSMMMAGRKLKVTLATIHCSFENILKQLNTDVILECINITYKTLVQDFAISTPRIAIAGINPHAGEGGLFGEEEATKILPAIERAQRKGINASGPFPADTIFFKASQGNYDAVVCMYHDQGLIPFKLLHFSDGVNVTMGLPIVRTSVDHGTAYDIAGKGLADHASLAEAVNMAHSIAENRQKSIPLPFS